MFRVQRLRYVQKVLCDGPEILQALLRPEAHSPALGWWQLVQEDLDWAAEYVKHLQGLPKIVEDYQFWCTKLRDAGPRWKRMCHVLLRKAALFRHIAAKQKNGKNNSENAACSLHRISLLQHLLLLPCFPVRIATRPSAMPRKSACVLWLHME